MVECHYTVGRLSADYLLSEFYKKKNLSSYSVVSLDYVVSLKFVSAIQRTSPHR